MKQIIVVKLGWVLVGDVTPTTRGFTLKNASVIRKWGTTKGLGELAQRGPLKDSVLDPIGVATVQAEATLFRIDCNDTAWP